jgi:2-polyprenyl-3-methyl-5-hydroxy-6-metoxy-1,4-benzoquinol methylase
MEEVSVAAPDYSDILTEEVIDKINQLEVVRQTGYNRVNFREALNFFVEKYIKQIPDFTRINSETVIADVGSGIGLFTFALRLSTNARIISVEPNPELVEGAKQIASYMGINEDIEWRTSGLGELDMKDREADIVFCIEVLEHVFGSKEAIYDLRRVADKFIVLSTPNLWFPVVAHDTRLPFCHWLPVPIRKQYARLFGRQNWEYRNIFWSPYSLNKHLKPFKRISKWYHYSRYQQFLKTFPVYYPYRGGFYVEKLHPVKRGFYGVVSKLGKHAYMFTPSLAGVYQRME